MFKKLLAILCAALLMLTATAPDARAEQFPLDGVPAVPPFPSEDELNTMLAAEPTDENCGHLLGMGITAHLMMKASKDSKSQAVYEINAKWLWHLTIIYGTIGCGDLKADIEASVIPIGKGTILSGW